MYIYPDNLRAKATLGLWELRNIAVIGILCLVSVFSFSRTGTAIPLVITGVFAFLTIQFEETSILDFIRYACSFFIFKQQIFEWGNNS